MAAGLLCVLPAALAAPPPPLLQSAPYAGSVATPDEVPVSAIPAAPAPVRRPPPPAAPRAKSPEESAAYEKFLRERSADERIRLAEDFLLQYPESELKQFAYQAATEAYRQKNDIGHMLTYAELTLAENPENLAALLLLAATLPESVDRNDPDHAERLDEAEAHARKSLEVVAKLIRAPRVSEALWGRTIKEAEASARLSLGLIGMMREDYPSAEKEYSAALALLENPDAVSFYRLGLAYSFLKKYDESLEALQKAAAAGGVRMRGTSGAQRDLVAEAIAFVQKSRPAPKSAASEPVEKEGMPESTR